MHSEIIASFSRCERLYLPQYSRFHLLGRLVGERYRDYAPICGRIEIPAFVFAAEDIRNVLVGKLICLARACACIEYLRSHPIDRVDA